MIIKIVQCLSVSLNYLFHEPLSEKLSEAHSLGFLVRWLEGSWPEQRHQWTSDTAPSWHQWGSPHSWQPESIITQCISRPLPKQWKKTTHFLFTRKHNVNPSSCSLFKEPFNIQWGEHHTWAAVLCGFLFSAHGQRAAPLWAMALFTRPLL